MNAVINAGMHRNKTPKHLRIGCIDDRIYRKPCDIPLPYRNSISDNRDIRQFHDSFISCSFLQIIILHSHHVIRHLLWHTDIHQRSKDPSFPFRILWRFKILIFIRISLEPFHKIVKSLFLRHFFAHAITFSPPLPQDMPSCSCRNANSFPVLSQKALHLE